MKLGSLIEMSKGQRKRKAQERAARVSARDAREAALKSGDQWYDKQKAKRRRQQADGGPHSVEEFRDALRSSKCVERVGERYINWDVPTSFLGREMPLSPEQTYGRVGYNISSYSISLAFRGVGDRDEVDFEDLPEGF
jgi:hypothetical protein